MKKAAFLDRDGVINRKAPEGQYVTCWEEMQFLPGVAKAINLLNRAGLSVIVVSNQRAVAKGLLTIPDLELMHERMRGKLAAAGAVIDAIYYCPHEKQPPCSCRKPSPGMLLTAAQEHRVDLAASWMIGDSDIDMEAGRKAGCKTARILKSGESESGRVDVIAESLVDAVGRILSLEPPSSV